MTKKPSLTQKAFETKLTEIAKLKGLIAPLEKKLEKYDEELSQLKYDVMRHMQEIRSKRTEPIGGYSVTRVAGKRITTITDEGAARRWLLENDYDLEDYSKLDTKKVLNTVDEALATTGEIVDFTETTTGQEYLTIKKEDK